MGFRSLFASKRSATALNTGLEQRHTLEHAKASTAPSSRSRPKKIVRGISDMFTASSRGEANTQHITNSPSITPHTTTRQYQSDLTGAAKPVKPAHTLLSTCAGSSTTSNSAIPCTQPADTPPTTASSIVLEAEGSKDNNNQQSDYATAMEELHDAEKILQQRHAMMKRPIPPQTSKKPSPAEALVGTSKPSRSTSTTTTTTFVTSYVETAVTHNNKDDDKKHDEYQTALSELHGAEKILQQRHTVIKLQAAAKTPRKAVTLGAIIKRPRLSPKASDQVAPQPSINPLPSHRDRKQAETANDACDAARRCQLIKDLAYRAIRGCDQALTAFEELNTHFILKARHMDGNGDDTPDLGLNFEGVHVFASQLRTVERTWLSRANIVLSLQTLLDRKLVGPDDYEQIVTQLFPNERRDLLQHEHFEILVKGLGTEGIITQSEAKSLVALSVSVEEFTAGLRWIGHSKKSRRASYTYNPAVLALFDIPKAAPTVYLYSSTTTSARPDLSHHLLILSEAAVYSQKFWRGYFFPDAQSKLYSFYSAYTITASGLGTPPHLTEYKRPWTYVETRLLQRGQLICNLLKSWESDTLTDFGIIRAVRGSFVRLPGQPNYDVHELSNFLYHRVADSGVPVSMIPEIMALHPEHDEAFANARLRMLVREGLRKKNDKFKAEEEARMAEIRQSKSTFESMRRRKMGKWMRAKEVWNKWFGKKEEEVRAFNPSAEE